MKKLLDSLPIPRHLALRIRSLAAICAWHSMVVPGLCVAASQQTGSTDPVRSAVVTRVTSEIVIDGSLDETPWRQAPKIGALVQRIPVAGAAPTERTEVTLLYDEENLYIGVMCYDSEPGQVLASQMARDARLNADDRLAIVLDTFRDQSNAFHFATNPAGAMVDGLVFANGETNDDWNGIWIVRTARTDDGWSAEFAIPFKTLSFPSGETVWGFNIARTIQRKLEENRWTGARFQTQFFQISEAGEITNLEGLAQGAGLDVRPFIARLWPRPGTGGDTVAGKPGLDVFYNITPSLKLSVTANTDFGETEVDARQINLTRFSIFFPEKRTFFLQDAGVFNFATTGIDPPGGIPGTGAEIFPFFSRKIGLLGGQEVPIDYGAKLTGRVGRTEVGMLDVRTRDVRSVDANNLLNVDASNLLVGRVKQNFLEQSYVGAILTSGNPASALSSSTVGVDVRLATSNFLGRNQNVLFNAYGLTSNNEGVADRQLVLWLRGALSQRQVRGSDALAGDSGELRSGDRLRAAQQRTDAAGRRQLQSAPETVDRHSADVSRHLLHALHPARQRIGRELGHLRHAGRLALQLGRLPAQPVRPEPDLRAPVRAVRDFPGRRAAGGRVPLHAHADLLHVGAEAAACRAALACGSAATGRAPRRRSRRASATSCLPTS